MIVWYRVSYLFINDHRAFKVAFKWSYSYFRWLVKLFSTLNSLISKTLMKNSGARGYLLGAWSAYFDSLLGAVPTRCVQFEFGVLAVQDVLAWHR